MAHADSRAIAAFGYEQGWYDALNARARGELPADVGPAFTGVVHLWRDAFLDATSPAQEPATTLAPGWVACEIDGVTHAFHLACKTAFIVPQVHRCGGSA